MARKRISGPKPEFLGSGKTLDSGVAETKSMFGVHPAPPIAQVAAESAAQNALDELVEDVARSRAEGRLVLQIMLADIVPDHLARDRVNADPEEMQALVDSIRKHGQRTPIEVTLLPDVPAGQPRYGLISGWRRLLALEQLYRETQDSRFKTILGLQRAPQDAAEAYVSMVEENEVRVGLSYYERARVAAEAVKRGVFDSEKQALLTLFATASRAKRSRIRSFVALYHALDDSLHFPAAIPERLGLSLFAALRKDRMLATNIEISLMQEPKRSAAQEMGILAENLRHSKAKSANVPRAEHLQEVLPDGTRLTLKGKRIEITGKTVSAELLERLKTLLSG